MTESFSGPSGFWSYVHRDNEQAEERILRLADRIRNEFSLVTGQDLELFVDRDSLAWGDQWRLRINMALQDTTFFIPVITPRYFASDECRKELFKFATHARSLAASELLLPILYVDVPDLAEESSDEAKALIAAAHYADWRELRLTDEGSEQYARAVYGLASRLAGIARDYASRPSVVPAEVAVPESSVETFDEPGLSDLIAAMEPVLPEWGESIAGFTPIMERIIEATQAATARFQTEGQESFAKKVLIAKEYAGQVEGPAGDLLRQGEQYATLLLSIDPGVRAIIAVAGEQEDSEDIRAACEMFESLRELIEISKQNEESLNVFIAALKQPARMFKDVRPPFQQMESGLRSVIDAQTIMDEWLRLMNESPLDCSVQSAGLA